MDELRWLEGKSVTVGWQGSSGLDRHDDEGDATIVDIATFQEFGTVAIPSRPMVRHTFDEERGDLEAFIEREIDDVMQGKQSAKRAYDRIGLKGVALLQQTITKADDWAEPLEQATIDKKGSTKPLIDTGRMRASVTYAVRHGDSIIGTEEGG
jgi:hypothetical protein